MRKAGALTPASEVPVSPDMGSKLPGADIVVSGDSLAFRSRLSAWSRWGDKPRNPAEQTLYGLAASKSGYVAFGYFPSCRQVSQRETDLCKGDSSCRRNLRIELLTMFFQVLQDCGGGHLVFLEEDGAHSVYHPG